MLRVASALRLATGPVSLSPASRPRSAACRGAARSHAGCPLLPQPLAAFAQQAGQGAGGGGHAGQGPAFIPPPQPSLSPRLAPVSPERTERLVIRTLPASLPSKPGVPGGLGPAWRGLGLRGAQGGAEQTLPLSRARAQRASLSLVLQGPQTRALLRAWATAPVVQRGPHRGSAPSGTFPRGTRR